MPSGSNFAQVSLQQAGQYITVNDNFQAVVPANFSGINLDQVSGLTAAFFGGDFWNGSAFVNRANGTLALTASTLNYIEENPATGAITKNTGSPSWNAALRQLYEISTTATGVNVITDYRRIAWQDAQARFNRLDIATNTITTSQPGIKITQTWNAGGVTFVANDIAITVTAAAAGSLLARWQAGAAGATLVAQLGHLGLFELPLALSATTGIRLGADVDLYRSAANILRTPDSLTVDTDLTVSGYATTGRLRSIEATATNVASSIEIGYDNNYGKIRVQGPNATTVPGIAIYLVESDGGGAITAFACDNTGLITIPSPPAFVASDKYLVVDASGNIHKSALGPAS